MRTVVATDFGTVELSFTWLPLFIGQDPILRKKVEDGLSKELVGKELSEDTLEWAHGRVIELICAHYPAIKGLDDCLDALKYIQFQ